jgi:nucleotide-binding universal stress UspA family protein
MTRAEAVTAPHVRSYLYVGVVGGRMTHRVLVPFELPDPEPLSPVLVTDLAPMDVVVLGHYSLPEQTPPSAAREQFETGAQVTLDALAAPFEDAGSTVTTRLVFGRDRQRTIDRVAVEEGCDAELDPAPTEAIERVLVPTRDAGNLERLTDFVRALVGESTKTVTLFHVLGPDESTEAAERMLANAREEITRLGLPAEMVETTVTDEQDPKQAIVERAGSYDVVVVGETDATTVERIFGELPDRIVDRTGTPVLVVRRND